MEPRSWLRRSHTSREIKNATISEFSTSLKSSKSREQFLIRLTLFLLHLRLTVKIFQFLRLSTKFMAVLRLSVNHIETISEAQREFRVKVTLDILDKLSWSEKKLHLTYYSTLCNATPPHVLLRAFSCLPAMYCTFLWFLINWRLHNVISIKRPGRKGLTKPPFFLHYRWTQPLFTLSISIDRLHRGETTRNWTKVKLR